MSDFAVVVATFVLVLKKCSFEVCLANGRLVVIFRCSLDNCGRVRHDRLCCRGDNDRFYLC